MSLIKLARTAPKHQITFSEATFYFFQKSILPKTMHSNKSAFYGEIHGTFNILYNSTIIVVVVGHTA